MIVIPSSSKRENPVLIMNKSKTNYIALSKYSKIDNFPAVSYCKDKALIPDPKNVIKPFKPNTNHSTKVRL